MLNELVEEYKNQNFVILSFAIDNTAEVTAFLKEHPVKYLVFDKTKELINHHFSTVLGYPTNIFLNKKGEVVAYRVGSGLRSAEIQKMKSDFKRIIDAELEK
jgi:thiol-disulfide isomerase/thioredoxin